MVRQEEAGPVDPRQLADEAYTLGYLRSGQVDKDDRQRFPWIEGEAANKEAPAGDPGPLAPVAAPQHTDRPQTIVDRQVEEALQALAALGKTRDRRARARLQRLKPQERKLHSAGGSMAVTLPAALIRALGWHPGDDVRIRMEGKAIIIE